MFRFIKTIFYASVITFLINSCGGGGSNNNTSTSIKQINIGVLVPSLNPYFAEMGTTYYNAIILAAQLFNNANPLQYKINLIVAYEDPTSITSITNAATKLINSGVAVVLCGLTSNEAIYSSSIFENALIPSISGGATSGTVKTLITNGSTHLVTLLGQNSSEVTPLSKYINSSDKVAIVTFSGSDYSQNIGQLFFNSINSIANTVKVYVYNNNLVETTNAIKNDNSYTKVFIPAPNDAYGVLLFNSLLANLNSNVVYLGSDALYSFNLLSETTGLTTTNNLISSLFFVDLNSIAMRFFLSNYSQKFGALNNPTYAALAFDAANILFAAISKIGTASISQSSFANQVITNINSITNYNGISGTIINFSNNIANRQVLILNAISGQNNFNILNPTGIYNFY